MFSLFQVEIPNYSFWIYWVLLHHYNFAYLFLYYQSSIDKWHHQVAEQDQLCWAGRSRVKKGTILKQEQLSDKEPMNCLFVYLNFTYHYVVMRQSPHFCTVTLDLLLAIKAQCNCIDATPTNMQHMPMPCLIDLFFLFLFKLISKHIISKQTVLHKDPRYIDKLSHNTVNTQHHSSKYRQPKMAFYTQKQG